MFKIVTIRLLLAFSLSFVFSCDLLEEKVAPPKAIQGVLDLKNWNFKKDGPVQLNGQWQFYWRKLSKDIDEDTKAEYVVAPNPWNKYKINNKKMGGSGYSTYRLKVLLPKKKPKLALKTGYWHTALRLKYNKRTFRAGFVAKDEEHTKAVVNIVILPLKKNKKLVLTAEVANFAHRNGGMLIAPVIGLASELQTTSTINKMIEAMLVAVLLLFGLYHLILYLMRPNKSVLWFAMLCFMFFIRFILVGERNLYLWLPNLNFHIHVFFEYLSLYLIVASVALLLQSIFPDEIKTWWRNFFVFISLLFSTTLILPPILYTKFLIAFQVVMLLLVLVAISVAIKAVIHKRNSAIIFLAGFTALGVSVILDIILTLYYNLNTSFSLFGMMGFVFAQAIVLSRRFMQAYDYAETLAVELEDKVEARTFALNKSKNEIEKLNEFSKKMNQTTDLDEIFTLVFEYLNQEYAIDGILVQLTDEVRNELHTYSITVPEYIDQAIISYVRNLYIPLNAKSGIMYKTYIRQRPFYLANINKISLREDISSTLIKQLQLKSFLIVPLIIQAKVIGQVLFTSYGQTLQLRKNEIHKITRFCEQMAGATYSSSLLAEAKVLRVEAQEAKALAEKEQKKSDTLLTKILPETIANELKETGVVEPMMFDSVSVLFTDFVGFTQVAETMLPDELVEELDQMFELFDMICEKYKVEKLKTIGDAYMGAGGLPEMNMTHPVDTCLAALEIETFMNQTKELRKQMQEEFWQLRIGINTGPVIAGVVGKSKFAYDIWGDTVNVASRMESSGKVGCINISEDTYLLVKDFFDCEYRGEIEIKNHGLMKMYFLNNLKAELVKDVKSRIPNQKFKEKYEKLERGEF